MSFWDSSALLPLCVNLPASGVLREIQQARGVPVVWWGAVVECASALERRVRQGQLSAARKLEAERLLDMLVAHWQEIQPTDAVRDRARRLLAVHNLRAADSLQLAAALVWAAERPAGRGFVCLDSRLSESALREGFTVLPAEAALL